MQMPFRLGLADKKYSFFTVKNFTEQKFQVHKNWEIGHFSDPEPEPDPPKRFARSRSRKNGAAPTPKRDTIVGK